MTTVNGRINAKGAVAITGQYRVQSINAPDLDVSIGSFIQDGLETGIFVEDPNAIELTVNVSSESLKGQWHWLQIVNAIPACCTWFAWPITMPNDMDRYHVEVVSKYGRDVIDIDVKRTRWCSIWTPLGLFPGIIADENVYGEEQSMEAVIGASRKVASNYVVEAVKLALQRRNVTPRCVRKVQAEIAEVDCEGRVIAHEAIRMFVLKEKPVLWKLFLGLQATISDLEKSKMKLHKALKDVGRDPNEDEDLQQLNLVCEELNQLKRRAWMNMEDAYLFACKYETNPSKKEYDERCHKILVECARVISELLGAHKNKLLHQVK